MPENQHITGFVNNITSDPKGNKTYVGVQSESEGGQGFYFPPNSDGLLDELKRAQNYELEVFILYRHDNETGDEIIEKLTVRDKKARNKPASRVKFRFGGLELDVPDADE